MRRLLPGFGFLTCCLVVLLGALAPAIAWRLLPHRPLGVVIVDKTVPDTSYRGHRAVIWVLNHMKLVHPGSLAPYDAAIDYAGFVPLTSRAWSVRQFPELLGANRLVYVADTYGVTAGDLGAGTEAGGGRLLFGGLSEEDLETLERAARGGVTLIAEFNLAAEPTADSVRRRSEALFGFHWSGWTGRRSTDLSVDVPGWAIAAWEAQAGTAWSYAGPGFLLVHQDGRIVVLAARDLEGAGLHFLPTSAGDSLGMRPASAPQGWFDLVEPVDAAVLGLYRWSVTPQGDSTLADAGIPRTAAAVLGRRAGSSRVFYLAGDFANAPRIPPWTELRWGAAVHRLVPEWWLPPNDAFFWRAYVPLLTHILDWASGTT